MVSLSSSRRWLWLLLLLTLVTVSCSHILPLLVAHIRPISESLGSLSILQWGVLSLLMLLLWRCEYRQSHTLLPLLIIGSLCRLLLIGVEPYLSNDYARYLFDGYIATQGLDPYSVNHDIPALANAKNLWQPPPEHAQYSTLYPPLALALFAFAAAFGPTIAPIAWQLMTITASILGLLITAQLFKAYQLKHGFALVALSPLLVFEAGVGQHIDSFSMLFVVLALWLWQQQYFKACAISIGLGAMIKILPLALLLPVFLATPSKRFRIATLCLSTIAMGYGISIAIGLVPIGSLSVFFEKWRFGAPIYNVLSMLTASLHYSVIAVLAGLMITIVVMMARNQHSLKIVAFNSCLLMSLPLFISPVSFPWYLMPLVPLLLIQQRYSLLPWLILSPLSYEVLNKFYCCQQWQPATWPLWFIGIAILVYLIDSMKLVYHTLGRTQ